MAQAVLTVVGYAVGSYFGYPQLGAMVGSMVGAAISQPHLEGPRVTDLTLAPSAYGQGVPKTYGSDRVACAPIWQQEIQETASSDDGKGGPEVTTYSYSQSFAVLIGEGRIRSIRRMWADAKLVYDARTTADAETQAESARFAQYWTLYQGTEAQDPDPTIEAIVGAGKVPALRGWAYIVFTDLPLERHGNRQPVISVEAVSEVEATQVDPAGNTTLEPLRIYPWAVTQATDYRPIHAKGNTSYGWLSEPTSPSSSTSFETIAQLQAAAWSSTGYYRTGGVDWCYQWAGPGWYSIGETYDPVIDGGPGVSQYWPNDPAPAPNDPQYVVAYSAAYKLPNAPLVAPDPALTVPPFTHTAIDSAQTFGIFSPWGERYIAYWRQIVPLGALPEPPAGYDPLAVIGPIGVGDGLYSYVQGGYTLRVKTERVPHHPAKDCYPGNPCMSPDGKAEKQGDPTRCVACDGTITPNRNWTIVSGTAKQLAAIEYRDGWLHQNALGPVLLPGDPDYSNSAFWDAARTAAIAAGTMQADVSYPATVSSYAQSDGSDALTDEVDDPDNTTVVLSDIVTHICEQAGLTAGQLDVTELTDNVLGYTRATRMAARAALEPLRRAFLFDAVESGAKICFRKRGRSVTSTIAADDLGAGLDNPEPQRVTTTRGQETELPDVLSVVYKDIDLDYQPGNQEARRRAGESDQQANIEIAVVLHASTAAQLAEIWLYDAWQGRTRRNISTTLAHAEVEPTDVIQVDDGDA